MMFQRSRWVDLAGGPWLTRSRAGRRWVKFAVGVADNGGADPVDGLPSEYTELIRAVVAFDAKEGQVMSFSNAAGSCSFVAGKALSAENAFVQRVSSVQSDVLVDTSDGLDFAMWILQQGVSVAHYYGEAVELRLDESAWFAVWIRRSAVAEVLPVIPDRPWLAPVRNHLRP